MIIDEATQSLSLKSDLPAVTMTAVMEEIMSGSAASAQIVSFLTALSAKGETAEELAAAVVVMRAHAARIVSRHRVVLDTCGTGGDGKHTFNISTAAAFVAAGAGVAVAKHGNRSVSSLSGSADVLEALGVNISLPVDRVRECLDSTGIAFLFAQNFHPAMKYAMAARKEIGRRTIFNILGPLSNPAGATHQLVGVYSADRARIIAEALAHLGTRHALVVHSLDGLDEVSISAPTVVFEVKDGRVGRAEAAPWDFDIPPAGLRGISGGSAQENARMLVDVLRKRPGPLRDIVVLNAGFAVYAADAARDIREGVRRARESIDSGAALGKLEQLKGYCV